MEVLHPTPIVIEESEEDKELQNELKLLVDRISDQDTKLHIPSLEMLRYLIRTSTTSMTSVPKPLKYLAPYYDTIKKIYERMKDPKAKKLCADIISVLAIGMVGGNKARRQRDCLEYCLKGTMRHVGDWGHEYVRQLEEEIIEHWSLNVLDTLHANKVLLELIDDIVKFDVKFHAEIQACDLLMEIDRLEILPKYLDSTTYQRVCLYLISCTKYVADIEGIKILELSLDIYLQFEEYTRALIVAIQMNRNDLVNKVFEDCTNETTLRQMAFIAARQRQKITLNPNKEDRDELMNIISNSYLSGFFLILARELDIMEPKLPEEVFKTWYEPVPLRPTILGENLDSARQNLASSFVNGFVNAGFGCDKLLTEEGGNKWIYRNKDHAMISATAALGLIHLWDVDGGLTPIDKYLYTTDDHVKAGALLALGIVNCRVQHECDPALALLADYVQSKSTSLKIGSILGLGLAYAGTNRVDVIALILPAIEQTQGVDTLAVACLACGLISVGTCNSEVSQAILARLIDAHNSETLLKNPHMRLVVLGLGLCYLGRQNDVETPNAALEVFSKPFKTMAQTLLQLCAYIGTGNVLMVQEMLGTCTDRVEELKENADGDKRPGSAKEKGKRSQRLKEMDPNSSQAIAALAAAAISTSDEISVDMCQRILGNMGRYGDPVVRRAMPLAIALTSVSRPHLPTIELLTKYSHDADEEVACNAIFSLGIVGAGTNNARLATTLRQLAGYHTRNASQLFMVRLSQGLVHLGKGTMTLSPFHQDRQLMDTCGMGALLIPLVAMLDPHTTILGRGHYLLYTLTAALYPRWLFTVNENLDPISVAVRVGQAVDVLGKAGTPKTITGIHTHMTPVLLAAGERAELASDVYAQSTPNLEGVCIVKKKADNLSEGTI